MDFVIVFFLKHTENIVFYFATIPVQTIDMFLLNAHLHRFEKLADFSGWFEEVISILSPNCYEYFVNIPK